MDSEIVWTEQALNQLDEILDYFIARNGSDIYSRKLKSEFEKRLLRLKQNPLSGVPTSNEKYRIVVVENYLIYYTLGNPIYIVLIWDGRRNPDEKDDQLSDLNK